MFAFSSVKTHRELVENLVLRDIKTRYKQSVLGYVWAIANPVITAIIIALVGGVLLGQAGGKNDFPFIIRAYFGLLLWNLFSGGLVGATDGLVVHLSLITKVYFPREVFPISAVLSKLVDFGFGLLGLLPFLVIYHDRVQIGFTAFLAIPFAIVLLLFTLGLGLFTSCANLFYRDVRYVVQISLSLWSYLVPNLYTMEKVIQASQKHPILYTIYLLNPVAALLEGGRRAVFPQTGDVAELTPYLLCAIVTSLATFFVGFIVFKRNEPQFAEFV